MSDASNMGWVIWRVAGKRAFVDAHDARFELPRHAVDALRIVAVEVGREAERVSQG
jgi:hypothetical protein